MAPTTTLGELLPGPFTAEFGPLRLRDRPEAGLEDVARRVAAGEPAGRPSRRGLMDRTRQNHRLLVAAHHDLSVAVATGEAPTLDAEWLLDNFYIIDEVFSEVLTDLPQGYYYELPSLARGPYSGLPRTFALAVGLLVYSDSALSEESLVRYVQAYQEVQPLTIGEIWAVPIMLRVGLLENLARLARQMQTTRADRNDAHRVIKVAAESGVPAFTDLPSDAYVVGVLHALRDLQEVRPELDERVRTWLARRDAPPADVLRREHQRQAGNQVSIGNAVTSLRLLAQIDWPKFVEQVSLVEHALRAEPTGVYAKQTFATRNACRDAVERLSKGSGVSELEVARQAIDLASRGDGEHAEQVGHYLIGDGRRELARQLRYRPRLGDAVREWMLDHPNTAYFGLMAVLTAALLAGAIALVRPETWLGALAVALVALLPASEIAVALVNLLVSRLVWPRVLPRLALENGIPEELATFVVIPGMITKPEGARALADRLELHYLANPDPNLHFALLTDFGDAASETTPADEASIQAAMDAIKALNVKHPREGRERFYVLHRRRVWNDAEGCWMGWERKRGKLHEFNRLIRGDTTTTYAFRSSDDLPRTRFVLTLDSDTVLPRDAARALIGTLAHPLNRARLSPDGRRVVGGYSILQPRVSFLYKAGTRSLFARLYGYSAGIDPYSAAVSDTYMDLFGRASFTGKGLYDVDAFEATAGVAFPDNHILSHDLIESNFARCGLVSNVEVFDDFPARYPAYSRREHRWARGDWQLLPWLTPRVPTAKNGPLPNPLPTLERWKVIDNLRRSLVPAALVVLLALGWTVLPGGAWLWTLLALVVLATPLVLHLWSSFLAIPAVGVQQAWVNARAGTLSTVGQLLLSIAFLAHQAWSLTDAMLRTLARLFVTRRHLLEWETAAAAEARLSGGLWTHGRTLWAGPFVAAAVTALLGWASPGSLPAASVFLVPWLLSPLCSWLVSLPTPEPRIDLTDDERREVRRLACKTWGFFEAFVGDTDHWLPPDNYQEGPVEAVAHRTSPTNMGLLLTSTLAANDLGYLTLAELADRLEKTFATFARLERLHGHFFNWYDTRGLVPLAPAYVSTVDSGNLLGCLLVIEQGLLEKIDAPLDVAAMAAGLRDRAALLAEVMPEARGLQSLLAEPPGDEAAWAVRLARLAEEAERLNAFLSSSGMPSSGVAGAEALRSPGDAPTGAALSRGFADTAPATQSNTPPGSRGDAKRLLDALTRSIRRQREELEQGVPADRLRDLIESARNYAEEMDFTFLYNPARNLFAIGYNVPRGSLDNAHYDLLASEACLTCFLAVARGHAPRKHWFQLGRLFIRVAGQPGLLSWGGTMFEYLMPRLFLPAPRGTLLETAWRAAVARQIEYGEQTGVPWGVSESAYHLTDAAGNYQYMAFGVPGLGLKRGLGRDLVVAPYATVLALPIAPREALANLRRLAAEGGEGPHGMYEAIDHTPDRLPKGEKFHVIPSYMAHHQGMSLLALAGTLQGDRMAARLAREPAVRAVDLLLQERVPLDAPTVPIREQAVGPPAEQSIDAVSRRLTTPTPREPRPHLLSNGRYSVMVTSCGAGHSTCDGLDVTRWREDLTQDAMGQFVYLRDGDSGEVWSATHRPVGRRADFYEAIYSVDKIDFHRRDGDVETLVEIAVSPAVDAEVRRVTITNHSSRPREIELTSYAEVALTPRAADVAHPAFQKLFLQTEWLPGPSAIVCRRRPRGPDEQPQFAIHVLAADHLVGEPTCETDRARFLGRRGTPERPAALNGPLSGTVGPVLDPVFSIRCRLRVPPGGKAVACFTTGVARTREQADGLVSRFHTMQAVEATFDLAWAHSRVELKDLNLSIREAQLYQRLAGHVLYPTAGLRAPGDVLTANRQGQSGLWRHGISGDLPIVVVRVPEGPGSIDRLRRVLSAHVYWATCGLIVDLVILNEVPTAYHDALHDEVMALIRASENRDKLNRPGGVFVRKADQFSPDDMTLLLSWARVVLTAEQGQLEELLALSTRSHPLPGPFRPTPGRRRPASSLPHPEGLLFFNGTGGLTPDGREYVLVPGPTGTPPAPWVNVLANACFGTLVSDSGSGYTWATNCQLNRLTPWSNDPVSDPPGEVVYVRDEQTGDVWSPTPLPAAASPTLVRHGAGYTVFEQQHREIDQVLTVFVPAEEPVKVSRLRLTNRGPDVRRLSVTFYAEWVLGTHRGATALHLTTDRDESGALLASNPANLVMAPAMAFAALSPAATSWTGDRTEFLGRDGSAALPAALRRVSLSGRVGPALDPCAALQTVVEIEPGQTVEVVALLGQAHGADEARCLIENYRSPVKVEAALADVQRRWDELFKRVQVTTPDAAVDLMVNRWLPYQVLTCRLWARTGFYQSGGAYGFRDQLQDVLALLLSAPQMARLQIVRAAGRQFKEGDVQHWWHPPAGAGVRARFSDDFLWLVFVACRYAETTGDDTVFDEPVPFLDAPPLGADQHEVYNQPRTSSETVSVYEHCVRALEHGWKLGTHGLPLMGIGDWNDGMNRVGVHGQGESVWVAWFQSVCLEMMAKAADRRNDGRAQTWRERAAQLRQAGEAAWDGAWYRRAYFDDGTPLGSAQNDECRIDSIAQSWAVLAGADEARSRQAVEEAFNHLVKADDRLVLLFDPPFDDGALQPGYIKGYVPGTRENGGQYTHAAIWLMQAAAQLGRGDLVETVLNILLPIRHADTPEGVARYKVEPYVVAADVYGRPPHVGRGGWTWYTGSAGWLYQAIVGDVLGVRREGDRLTFRPCVPPGWSGHRVVFLYGTSRYEIKFEGAGTRIASVDGDSLLRDDGQTRQVRVKLAAE